MKADLSSGHMPEQSLTLLRPSTLVGIVLLMVTAATSELWIGRQLWGTSGIPGLWSGDIWSSHNSQFLADAYSFTHITHGVLLYALLSFVLKTGPPYTSLLVAVGLESFWEVIENTDTVIERYRTATISLNYYGDSIANSMGDILACILGFVLASRLPRRVVIAGTIALEILLLVWTRDNLTLNVIMLIHPTRALTLWQLGK
jgi:Protein of unknown function (DUF2585)